MNSSISNAAFSDQPENYNSIETEDRKSILVFNEAIGDTTIRPMRSQILRQIRPERSVQRDEPNSNKPKEEQC